jgi:hypothetical protein
MRSARILVGKIEGKRQLRDLGVNGMIKKISFRNTMKLCGRNACDSGQGSVVSFCEDDNERSISVKEGIVS